MREDIEILLTWDTDSGAAADDVLLTIINTKKKFVTVIRRGRMIHLVGGDDWLSTAQALDAVKRILSTGRD